MAPPNPQVSVFHFTSRISSAKIRKYKLATERGMSNTNGHRSSANNAPVTSTSVKVPLDSSIITNGEPPSKKPKLKLKVRQPPDVSPISDTIAVARPTRNSQLRFRYSDDMILEDESLRLPSPASSELSSLKSTPPVAVNESEFAKEPTPTSANQEYGDFMSYYILDADKDDQPKTPAPAPAPAVKAPETSKPEPRRKPSRQRQTKSHAELQPPQHLKEQTPAQHALAQAQRETTFRHQVPHHVHQPQYPMPQHHLPSAPPQPPPPPPPPPPAMPQVQLIDFEPPARPKGPKDSETVRQMIDKLEALSTALTNFGGVPTVPKLPGHQDSQKSANASDKTKLDNPVDDFLGMFEDDEDDDEDGNSDKKAGSPDLNYALQKPGRPDGPLSYGIQFIQNALKSWAQQRLTHSYAAQIQQAHQQYLQQLHLHRRDPGRPRKFGEREDPEPPKPPPPPQTLRVKASATPEGIAVKAFQEVLESGCLQMNAVLPAELTRALMHLYMQIDHLINQGAKNETPWQCLSYGAQIAANRARVEKWKEAQARAHEELARQQHLANQHMMQQMALPLHQQGRVLAGQMQYAHAIDLERQRALQYAQPLRPGQHPIPSHLPGHQPLDRRSSIPHPQSPAGMVRNGSPATNSNSTNVGLGMPHGLPPHPSPTHFDSIQQQQHMDRVKMYVPGYMPRSGTQMKFSFAPSNQKAVEVFGPNAFPDSSAHGAYIANRGPMSAAPGQSPLAATANNASNGSSVPVTQSIEINGHTRNATRPCYNHVDKDASIIKHEVRHTANGAAPTPSKEPAVSSKVPAKRSLSSTDATSPAISYPKNVILNGAGHSKGVMVPRDESDGRSDKITRRYPREDAIVLDD